MRSLFALMAAVAVGLVLPGAVPAGNVHTSGTAPLSFSLAGENLQYPVEQESPNFFYDCGGDPTCGDPSTWVGNPTLCAWDVDDYVDMAGSGDLVGTAAGSLCVVADGYDSIGGDNHAISVSVTAPSDALEVTLSNDQGVSYRPTAVENGRSSWLYQICVRDLTGYPNPPDWYPVIAGSNGGTGIVANYTLTVSSAKKTHGVSGVLQAGHGLWGICGT